jgi:hypothetical protein
MVLTGIGGVKVNEKHKRDSIDFSVNLQISNFTRNQERRKRMPMEKNKQLPCSFFAILELVLSTRLLATYRVYITIKRTTQ